ncbi:phosphoribosylglycinamide formyltransferase 2 [Striga asiatica]|uniref:Phosphoribosylglycinamide formyltransferase 2 n=1 Tax=Striga asiatica TaxID=4170 RepID=A0A5A7QXT6_STRAF|nr:phosphoribosylglycinamide formyltransferase 2 [Striga asiatica]
MFAFKSMSYTSLKDLLPESSAGGGRSRKEIAIRDPLLQHAAWAYLQPGAREEDGRRWWRRLAGRCGVVLGCLNGVVSVVCKGLFGERADKGNEDNMTID